MNHRQRAVSYGQPGFHDCELYLGSVRGVREWWLPHHLVLTGARSGRWHPGENRAVCAALDAPFGHVAPDRDCGCGFWAYWDPEFVTSWPLPARKVTGVIEGYGRTIVGERGFRSQKARILAVFVHKLHPSLMSSAYEAQRLQRETERSVARDYQITVTGSLKQLLAEFPLTSDYLEGDVA